MTTGSSGGFLYAFLAAFDAGDTVVLARPGYPAYRNMLSALDCNVVELACGPTERFQPTIAQLDALDTPPAGLVVASPANPTGTMLPAHELRALAEWCDAHGTRLISDEIYHGITYGAEVATSWQFSQSPVVVNSFSKYFSMTGWRIGWLLVPDELRDAVFRLAGNFTICPPAVSQVGGSSRLRRIRRARRERPAHRRESRDAARRVAVHRDYQDRPTGRGLLHLRGRVGVDRRLDQRGLARLLDEAGVAVAPGIDFDTVDGNKFIRLCFAGDGVAIRRGIEQFGEWISGQPPV